MMDGGQVIGKAVKVGSDMNKVKKVVLTLVKTCNLAAFDDLHNSGEWTELEMGVHSRKDADRKTWYYTAMAIAAHFNQLEVMRWLIEKGAKMDEIRELHQLPSNAAAGVGFIEGLELLKEKGCDLSKVNSNGRTSAHEAAGVGHLPALHLLHNYNLPMHVKDKDGRTPADLATVKGHTECAAFLKEVMRINKQIHDLVEVGDLKSLRRLYAEKAWAVSEIVLHSEKGGDDTWHWTAMALAANCKQLEVMQWLIEKGAKVDEIRELHQLPSIAAAGAGFIEGLELLKAKGCDLSKAASNGATPVLCAAEAGRLPALRLLHSCECPMDCVDNQGSTVAHAAAANNHLNIIQQLDEWNVPLDKEDVHGNTPADLAYSQGHPESGDLIWRLAKQRNQCHRILQEITNAIEANEFAAAHHLFRSDKGQEACSKMESAFAPVVQALEQHSTMMADSWIDEEGTAGSGAGGQKKGKKKSGDSSSSSKKKAVKDEPAIQLDDDTLIDMIDRRLKGTDDDWSSLSPARLRALLVQASPGAAVSEKRIKGIKAAVLEHRAILASIESGEVVGCCICMDGVADYVLVHGNTGHQCVCKACAERIYASSLPCNICRQTIDYVQTAALVDRGQVTVYHDQQ